MKSRRIIDTHSKSIHSDICKNFIYIKKNQIIRKNKKSKQSNYKNGVYFLLEGGPRASEHSVLLFLEGPWRKFLRNLSIDLGL